MNKVNELRQKLAATIAKAREILDAAEAEDRGLTEEEQTSYEDLTESADQLEARIATLVDLETREASVESGQGAETREDTSIMHGAPAFHQTSTPDTEEGVFCRYIRSGDLGAANELRASNDTTMNITTDADGGYLVPTGHFNGIIKQARPLALPFLMNVRRIPGQGTTVNVPIDNEGDTGVFVSTAESGSFDRDAPAVGQVAMTLVKYTKKVDLTYELLQDEDSALMEFLDFYVGAGYAATLNSLMVTEALADGTAALTLDSATVIAASEIPELFYKLTSEYARGNLAWLVARATEGEIFSLASSSIYTFAGHPQGQNGQQPRLWGVPLYTDAGMGATAASAKSMLIADWSYMGMRLEPQMTLLRDPYTRSSSGEVILNYYFRADFEVLQAAAFQYASHPTA
jgi:HK97 family phage major capsid protein